MSMNCPHHVMWVVAIERGMHQCIQCKQVVTKKDISPPFAELPASFQRRWDAHEGIAGDASQPGA